MIINYALLHIKKYTDKQNHLITRYQYTGKYLGVKSN